MNRILFAKLPTLARYFEELREKLVLNHPENGDGVQFEIEKTRSDLISGEFFRKRTAKFKSYTESGKIAEEEREVVDVYSFRIDARYGWIELYNPPRSLGVFMNQLSFLSSGKLSYGLLHLDIVRVVEFLREFGDYEVRSLKFKDLVLERAHLSLSGRAVGADLPQSFLDVSGQKAEDVESISGVFLKTESKLKEKVEIRRNSVVCTSADLSTDRKTFFRELTYVCKVG